MKTAEQILKETVGEECIWEEMNNLTNVPIDRVIEAMEIYKNQIRFPVHVAIDWFRCLTDRAQYMYARKYLGKEIDTENISTQEIVTIYSKWANK